MAVSSEDGSKTESITWMTPFEASMSVMMTWVF
jgi:hypothetical protein